jgi:BlaI family penicillinase repressor
MQSYFEENERISPMIKLSEAEWKVMNLLWEEAPQTIMQITNHFKETTGWTKHTVMTFLRRMEEKGAVHYEDGGRAKQYYPDIERTEAALQETEEFLDKVFGGRLGLMLNTMVEKKALSDAEITELYGILKKAEEEKR